MVTVRYSTEENTKSRAKSKSPGLELQQNHYGIANGFRIFLLFILAIFKNWFVVFFEMKHQKKLTIFKQAILWPSAHLRCCAITRTLILNLLSQTLVKILK